MTFQALHWQHDYATGVKEIDLQHHYFLSLINRIASELQSANDPKYRERLYEELVRYAAFHFISEENLMIKYGYPDLERHRMLHHNLKDDLSARCMLQREEGLLEFLVNWFIHHTVTEDRHIGEYVARHHSGMPGATHSAA